MNTNLAQDFLSWAYPNRMTNKDKFYEHVLPWLVLLIGPVVLYLVLANFIVALVVISSFFRAILNFIGL